MPDVPTLTEQREQSWPLKMTNNAVHSTYINSSKKEDSTVCQ